MFFELVSRRYETAAMLITSNCSVAKWAMVFADTVVARAILDRLLRHSHVLTIRGDSYRLRAERKSGLIKPPPGDGPSGRLRLPSARHRRSQPSTETMNPRRGQFFMTQRGQFRIAFDTNKSGRYGQHYTRLSSTDSIRFAPRESQFVGPRRKATLVVAIEAALLGVDDACPPVKSDGGMNSRNGVW